MSKAIVIGPIKCNIAAVLFTRRFPPHVKESSFACQTKLLLLKNGFISRVLRFVLGGVYCFAIYLTFFTLFGINNFYTCGYHAKLNSSGNICSAKKLRWRLANLRSALYFFCQIALAICQTRFSGLHKLKTTESPER